jgi:hypothetical protein
MPAMIFFYHQNISTTAVVVFQKISETDVDRKVTMQPWIDDILGMLVIVSYENLR